MNAITPASVLAGPRTVLLVIGVWTTNGILVMLRAVDNIDLGLFHKIGPKYRPVRRVLDPTVAFIWKMFAGGLTWTGSLFSAKFVRDYNRRSFVQWSRIRGIQAKFVGRRRPNGFPGELHPLAPSAYWSNGPASGVSLSKSGPHDNEPDFDANGFQTILLAPIAENYPRNTTTGLSLSTLTLRIHMPSLPRFATRLQVHRAASWVGTLVLRGAKMIIYGFIFVLSSVFYLGKLFVTQPLALLGFLKPRRVFRVRFLLLLLLASISFWFFGLREHYGPKKAVAIALGTQTVLATTTVTAEDGSTATITTEIANIEAATTTTATTDGTLTTTTAVDAAATDAAATSVAAAGVAAAGVVFEPTKAATATAGKTSAVITGTAAVNGTAAAEPEAEPVDISFKDADLTDWVNYLVDKHHLGSDFKYQAVQFAPLFDAKTFNKTADYPTASHPVDDHTPSLHVMEQDLVPGPFGFHPSDGGFHNIHMPGRAAIKADERHVKLQYLNDFGEKYPEGHMGKTKSEIKQLLADQQRIRKEIANTKKMAEKIAQAMIQAKVDTENGVVKTGHGGSDGHGDETVNEEFAAWFDGLWVYRYKDGHLKAYSVPHPSDKAGEVFPGDVSDEEKKLFDMLNAELPDPEPEEKPAPKTDDKPAQKPVQQPAEADIEVATPAIELSKEEKNAAVLAAALQSIKEWQKEHDKISESIQAAIDAVEGKSSPVKRHDVAVDTAPGNSAVKKEAASEAEAAKADATKNGNNGKGDKRSKDDKSKDDKSKDGKSKDGKSKDGKSKDDKNKINGDATKVDNTIIDAPFAELEDYFSTAEANNVTGIEMPLISDTTGSKALDKMLKHGAVKNAKNTKKPVNNGIVVSYDEASLVTITANSTSVVVTDGDVKFVIADGGINLVNETPKNVDVERFLSAPEPATPTQTPKKKTKGGKKKDKGKKKSPVAPAKVVPTVKASMSHLELPKGAIQLPTSGRGFVQNLEPAEDVWKEVAGGKTNKQGKVFFKSEWRRVPERKEGEPPLLPGVPKGAAVDASGLMVGISTTYSRLHNNDFAAIDDWARWLTDGNGQSNGAFLYLALHRPRNNETATIRDLLTERGIFFDIVEDWGHMNEGVGGGPQDVHPLPVVPDADSIRYANLLGWMGMYCYSSFGDGRPAVQHEQKIKDGDGKMYKSKYEMRQPDKWDVLVYALLDDDIFVPDMGRLVAKLQEHRGLRKGYDPRIGRSLFEPDLDSSMWLGFPSDPWSDWTFHNGTTLYNQFLWEHETYGNATTTKNLDDRFVNPDLATYLPSAYGGGAMFIFADLAHKMADLDCLRRSMGDNLINTVFKANRAAFVRGEHPEASWDEQLYRCTVQSIPDARLRLIPSYYTPSDAAVYGTEYEAATMSSTFSKHLARLTQYNGGTHPMVVHNHRTWHNFDVGAAHQVTDVCGKDGFLQRFAFADGWVLTNGHSLTHYDGLSTKTLEYRCGFDGLEFSDLYGGNELNMAEANTPQMQERYRVHQQQRQYYDLLHITLEHAQRPRDAQALDWTGQQKTYRLVETSVAEDGTVLQAYLRRAANPLRDLTAIGGKEYFEDAKRRMAIPDGALAGLDGSAADQATEAPAPDADELFVAIWQPANDTSKLHTSKNAMAGPTQVRQHGSGMSWLLIFWALLLAGAIVYGIWHLGQIGALQTVADAVQRHYLPLCSVLFGLLFVLWLIPHIHLSLHVPDVSRPLKSI